MKLTSNDPAAIERFILDTLAAPVYVPAFSRLMLPDATKYAKNTAKGCSHMIYVYDETGGAVLAFSDGVNFRRVTDRAIVS